MKPAKPPAQEPDGLFKTPLERFIDMQHPLVVLADRIDWNALDAGIVGCFGTAGRPAVPTRFMLGMLILKATYDLSDEAVFQRWTCDPYFQFSLVRPISSTGCHMSVPGSATGAIDLGRTFWMRCCVKA